MLSVLLCGLREASHVLGNTGAKPILHPWVQEFYQFYPVLGLGSGERLLRHFQTPTLHWIHVSLRCTLVVVPGQTPPEKKKKERERERERTENSQSLVSRCPLL